MADLSNLYFATNPRDREYAIGVFDHLDKLECKDETVHELINGISQGNLLRKLSIDAYDCAEGRKSLREVLDALEVLNLRQVGEAERQGEVPSDQDFVTDDLDEIVSQSIKAPGLRWRLSTLNKMLGSLRKGDFGFVFARPETGKTTFLASEVSYMATQLELEDGPILHLNNEEQGTKVMLRYYQATLGCTLTELYRDLSGAKKKFKEITKGKIKIYDSASISKQQVEKLCRTLKPSLIVIDQIDKLKGFDNDREDLRLGGIYQWARELAKDFAPVVGICQADGTGEGQRWLSMANVANAKTAKQAEADWILGIGKQNEEGFDTIRYLHLSKNKLLGDEDTDPEMRHGRMEVLIEPERARYRDLT